MHKLRYILLFSLLFVYSWNSKIYASEACWRLADSFTEGLGHGLGQGFMQILAPHVEKVPGYLADGAIRTASCINNGFSSLKDKDTRNNCLIISGCGLVTTAGAYCSIKYIRNLNRISNAEYRREKQQDIFREHKMLAEERIRFMEESDAWDDLTEEEVREIRREIFQEEADKAREKIACSYSPR